MKADRIYNDGLYQSNNNWVLKRQMRNDCFFKSIAAIIGPGTNSIFVGVRVAFVVKGYCAH